MRTISGVTVRDIPAAICPTQYWNFISRLGDVHNLMCIKNYTKWSERQRMLDYCHNIVPKSKPSWQKKRTSSNSSWDGPQPIEYRIGNQSKGERGTGKGEIATIFPRADNFSVRKELRSWISGSDKAKFIQIMHLPAVVASKSRAREMEDNYGFVAE